MNLLVELKVVNPLVELLALMNPLVFLVMLLYPSFHPTDSLHSDKMLILTKATKNFSNLFLCLKQLFDLF